MQKQVVLVMETDRFPFGEYDHPTSNSPTTQKKVRILVRKKFPTSSLQERNQLLQKIGIIRNFDISSIIKIQQVLEEQNGIHVLMQYIDTPGLQFVKKNKVDLLYKQLCELERQFRQQGIGIQWTWYSIGIGSDMQLKYYVDLSKIFITNQKNKLKISNQKSINLMIKNIQQQFHQPESKKYNEQIQQKKQVKINNNTNNTNNTNNNKSKFDPQSSYYSATNKSRQSVHPNTPNQKIRINWRQIQQNQQILNDFINVLEDQSEEQQKKLQKYLKSKKPRFEEQSQFQMEYLEQSNNNQDMQEAYKTAGQLSYDVPHNNNNKSSVTNSYSIFTNNSNANNKNQGNSKNSKNNPGTTKTNNSNNTNIIKSAVIPSPRHIDYPDDNKHKKNTYNNNSQAIHLKNINNIQSMKCSKQHQQQQQQYNRQSNNYQEQEVVWENPPHSYSYHPHSNIHDEDIKQQVQKAIERSRKVMKIFMMVTKNKSYK